ncbi:hypothetical protein [Algoriphagus algorifonticola]|uniref:hypothetical protein n=1 Tax=Algoriphagus algorifonticola TaxID=2593007 RepID=UPI0011A0BFA2|nr:hypothetical protein [Algoriphagus algorifonticola]
MNSKYLKLEKDTIRRHILLIGILFIFSNYTLAQSLVKSQMDQLDSIVRPASNSVGFSVVKDSDLANFKSSLESQLKSIEDELAQISKKNDSLQYLVDLGKTESSNEAQTEQKPVFASSSDSDLPIPLPIFYAIIVVLIIYAGYISLRFFSNQSILRTNEERIINIEKEFEAHKRRAVERERKLKRELIDVKRDQGIEPEEDEE